MNACRLVLPCAIALAAALGCGGVQLDAQDAGREAAAGGGGSVGAAGDGGFDVRVEDAGDVGEGASDDAAPACAGLSGLPSAGNHVQQCASDCLRALCTRSDGARCAGGKVTGGQFYCPGSGDIITPACVASCP